MILLDTDHLSVFLDARDRRNDRLNARMEAVADSVACSIVSIEEAMRGWLALIHRLRDVNQQVTAYSKLQQLFNVLGQWEVLPFDEGAAREFKKLRQQRVRIGAMDLKIAAIAIKNGATLLTANLRDFEKVPNLRLENWLV
jgi:tRNA(fMet)-specific endonuclease VapC